MIVITQKYITECEAQMLCMQMFTRALHCAHSINVLLGESDWDC